MENIKINQWLTLVADLGVIAGILFLAIEIRQNTEMMQAQTRDAMTQKQMDFFMGIGSNEFAHQLFFTGLTESPESSEVNGASALAFRFLAMSNLRMWENEWYQYRKGLYEEAEFQTRSSLWADAVTQPGLNALWDAQKNAYSPDFRNYLDNLITDTAQN